MARSTRLRSVTDEPAETLAPGGLPPGLPTPAGSPAAQPEPGTTDRGPRDSPRSGRRDSLGRRIGYNWWREYVHDIWYAADARWREERDQECVGYPADEALYGLYGESRDTPRRPTFKQCLIESSGLADSLRNGAAA